MASKLLPRDRMKSSSTATGREHRPAVAQIDFGPTRGPGEGKAVVAGGYFVADDHNGDRLIVALPLRIERAS